MSSIQNNEFIETAFTEGDVGVAQAVPVEELIQKCEFLNIPRDNADVFTKPKN